MNDLLRHLPGTDNIRREFLKKVQAISTRLGFPELWLLTVMFSESGLNPKAINPVTGASGLIQFMPKTAAALGTSTAELRTMTAFQQLNYVERYFAPHKSRINSYADLYLVTFYPKALIETWTDAHSFPPAVVKSNPALDRNRDGSLSLAEFKEWIYRRVPAGIDVAELKKKADRPLGASLPASSPASALVQASNNHVPGHGGA